MIIDSDTKSVFDAARQGKIQSIKALRERTGLGLKESKDAIDYAMSPWHNQTLTLSDENQFAERLADYMSRNGWVFGAHDINKLAPSERTSSILGDILRQLTEQGEMIKDILHMLTEGD